MFPWFLKRRILESFFGYSLHPECRIGFSFVYPVRLAMAQGARIGHLSFVAGMDEVQLGENALIGNFNWISGVPACRRPAGFAPRTRFTLGRESALTNRHYVDVQSELTVGDFTTIAGVRSTLLTHGIDYEQSVQTSAPIRIGDYCLVGSGVVILPGAEVGNRVVIGAGSIVTRGVYQDLSLYAGSPARFRKALPPTAKYFSREKGFVL